MNKPGAPPLPWSWIAENYLEMGDPKTLYQELDEKVVKEIMSKTMPNTPMFQKKSSSGEPEGVPMTVVLLKAKLNSSVKQFCLLKDISKIDTYLFKKHILTLYDPTILNQYNVSLNKNGKTVKVTKKTQTSININAFTFPAFGSKGAKAMIMDGKLKEVINFHILRKHPTDYDNCLACRVIRSFLQYEFHQKADKKIKSGIGSDIIKAIEGVDTMHAPAIVVAKPGESSITHPKINPLTSKEITDGDTEIVNQPINTSCTTTYSGFAESQCTCGEIIINWDVKPQPVITPDEMTKIMIKKQAEIASDASSFLDSKEMGLKFVTKKVEELLEEDDDLFTEGKSWG